MDFWQSLFGMVRVQITTSDPEEFIRKMLRANISLFNMHYTNDFTVTGELSRRQLSQTKTCVRRSDGEIKVMGRLGAFWVFKRMLCRPILLLSIFIIFAGSLIIPTRIYFVNVEGNDRIPENYILEQAQLCGIDFGASRKLIRSEHIKNHLLERIPELRWVGIRTDGCVATICVQERADFERNEEVRGVRSLIAACDGIIEQCTVMKGNCLCKVGDAVKEGQTLVSAYTDCGNCILAQEADAEIYAQTNRKIQVKSLAEYQFRDQDYTLTTNYILIIGKKQINFCKDSGISDASCVKMMETKQLSLPGDFGLPVFLVIEKFYQYKSSPMNVSELSWVEDYARTYLKSLMVGGTLLSERVGYTRNADNIVLDAQYSCYEMIAVPKYEETLG